MPDAERSSDPGACREAALRLLERQRRTRADLERRLRDKGYAGATLSGVLDRLAAVGLVDDVEYARAFMAGRRARRSAGARRIEQELRARGVAAEDVAAAAARLDAEQAEQKAKRLAASEQRARLDEEAARKEAEKAELRSLQSTAREADRSYKEKARSAQQARPWR